MEHEASVHASNAGESAHLPALDGVRGIAILLVLLTHLGAILRDTWVGRHLGFGWMGVDLFFVLSGFLITRILLATRKGPSYYRRFYIRRGLRIWPVYYVYVAVMLLLMHGLSQFPHAFPVSTVSPVWLFLLFLQNLNPASLFCFRDSLFSVTWSLCIEEHFYLAWPGCVRHLSRRALLLVLGSVFAISPVLRLAAHWWLRGASYSDWFQTVTRFTPLHLDAISAGCILGILWSGRRTAPEGESARWFPGLFLGLLLGGLAGTIVCLRLQDSPNAFSFCFSAIAVMFTGFVGLALNGRFQPVLLNAPLRYVGKISYGLYLIHPAIFLFLQSHHVLQRLGWNRHPAGVEALAAAAAVGLSFGIAALSWEFYEKRVLQLKSRLAP